MRVGTKSLLVGVHQLVWHPITVLLAFRRVHRRWPALWELVGIALHDIGYLFSSDMDGYSGVTHPLVGASLAAKIVGIFSADRAFDVYFFVLYHSSTFAKLHRATPSALYLPDKVSLLYDPPAFYRLRARLSGEIKEYLANSPKKTEAEWYAWYRASVERKLKSHERI